MSADCSHDFLSVATEVFDEGGFRWLQVAVRCSGCHELFHFRGLSAGMPNADEPTVTADGYELRAPILPGPGAVVGLLRLAGMDQQLRPPGSAQTAEPGGADGAAGG